MVFARSPGARFHLRVEDLDPQRSRREHEHEQIADLHALSLSVPTYAHVPLVLRPDGARLAKRDDAATMADRGQTGQRTLALLAHSLGLAADREEVSAPWELLEEFSPQRIPREPLVL